MIIAIVTMVVAAVSIDMHPASAHAPADTIMVLTHSHDERVESGAEHPNKGVHHDHHAELAFDTGIVLLSPLDHHHRHPDQGVSGQLTLTLDRPPQTAQC
ncbi:hypothetical protein [Pannonibacter phragmitetus]|uniref:hypothetical protein n=1 Tax=Pannonibacter phragmitetus TaxID=121719 RepID=UPI0013CE86A6|nr:hypothetical protein [Pannonibacter phragmitetus]